MVRPLHWRSRRLSHTIDKYASHSVSYRVPNEELAGGYNGHERLAVPWHHRGERLGFEVDYRIVFVVRYTEVLAGADNGTLRRRQRNFLQTGISDISVANFVRRLMYSPGRVGVFEQESRFLSVVRGPHTMKPGQGPLWELNFQAMADCSTAEGQALAEHNDPYESPSRPEQNILHP